MSVEGTKMVGLLYILRQGMKEFYLTIELVALLIIRNGNVIICKKLLQTDSSILFTLSRNGRSCFHIAGLNTFLLNLQS